MEKWYQLGGQSSIFWDPKQPTEAQQTLLVNEVKQLKITPKVTECVQRGGLVVLSAEEAREHLEKNEALKNQLSSKDQAQKTLDSASTKEEEAKSTLREATLKLKQAEDIELENAELRVDKDALIKRVQELEKANPDDKLKAENDQLKTQFKESDKAVKALEKKIADMEKAANKTVTPAPEEKPKA